ncbi:MAG TPA: cytochrome P450 [Candidatus Sulfotelmatobacter sp.]|nr:cytochrome P450 [Candidatus Sulfotelmatobacter sp.]
MVVIADSTATPRLAGPVPPPGPLPALTAIRRARDNFIAIYPEQAYQETVIAQRFLWFRSWIVSDPAGIRHVLLDNAGNYHKSELGRRILEPGLGRGLLTSEGETWRAHRRIMAPAFDHRSILGYAPIISGAAEALLEDWHGQPADSEVEIATAMSRLTLAIIARTMFASESEAIVDIIERDFATYQADIQPNLLDYVGGPGWLAGWRRVRRARRAHRAFDAVIARLVADRTKAGPDAPKDLLARLIAARDEETGGGMSAEEVRDQVVTIFLAGHETTAVALTWTWYLLARHPAVEAKLHAELDRVLAGRTPGHGDIANLPYTRMVIEEAMRLYPPAPGLSREAIGDDEVCGQKVPKGSLIFIIPWLVHRHRRLWDDPDRFEPERFAAERAAARSRFAYLPFGAGPRICIGAAFAMVEAVLLLASLAQRFRLRLVPGWPVEPQALITLRPRHGIMMRLQPRP